MGIRNGRAAVSLQRLKRSLSSIEGETQGNKNSEPYEFRGYTFSNFLVFVKLFSAEIFISLLFLLLGFGQKLFSNTFSIDTQSMIQVPDALYGSWFELDRFGLVWLKRLLGLSWYNNALASFLMVVFLGVAAIVWAYLFYGVSQDRETFHPAFFMIPFVVSPVMAEQLGFLLQAPEIDIAMMLVVISLMTLINALQQRKWEQYVLSILSAAVAFSIYAALITLFVPAVAMLLLIHCRHTRKIRKKLWLSVGISAVVCIFSYAIYFVMNKVVMKIVGVRTNAYISDKSRWGIDSLSVVLESIKHHLKVMYEGIGIYYSLAFTILAAIFVVFSVVLFFRKQVSIFYPVVACLICIAPMLMSVILGSTVSVRTEIAYPLVFAFVALFIGNELSGSTIKLCSVVAWILVLLIGFNQGFITNRIFYTESVVYNQDVLLSRSIADRVGELGYGEVPSVPVVFEGRHAPTCNKSCWQPDQLDLVGRSLFDITFSTQHGTWVKGQFMGAQGFQYQFPTGKQIKDADSKASKLPHWPAKGSVAKEQDYIIVNF